MYTVAYNYCTSSRMGFDTHGSGKGALLMPNNGILPQSYLGANLIGSDLYSNLTKYFSTHIETSLEVC